MGDPDKKSEERGMDLGLEKAIADDFCTYDCFMQPYHSPDEANELENTCCDQTGQPQTQIMEQDKNDPRLQVRIAKFIIFNSGYFV